MNSARRRRAVIATAVVLCAVAVLVRLACSPIGVALVLRSQGLRLAGGEIGVGLQETTATRLVVTTLRGEPVLTADALDLRYDLGSLLRGRPHAFAVTELRARRPVLSLERRSDGSWNLPGVGGGGPAAPSAGGTVLPAHLAFDLSATDGSVILRQPEPLDRAARALRVDNIAVAATVDTDRLSGYRLSARILGRPVRAQGIIDASRGIAVHRARAAALPLATLLNALVDSSSFVTTGGVLRNLDFTAYGNGRPGTAILGDQVSLRADVAQFAANVSGLAEPLVGVHGGLALTGDTVTFDHAAGSIADMPFSAAGAVYDFAAPRLQIALDGRGDATQIRRLFSFSKDLPIDGNLALHATVEGLATSPTVIIDAGRTRLSYGDLPVTLDRATVIYQDGAVDLSPVALHYGKLALDAAGSIMVGEHVRPAIALRATAPTSALPYLADVFGGTTDAFVQLGGTDQALNGRAFIEGRDGSRSLRGLAHLDGGGEGILGPIALEDAGRTQLLAGGALVRPRGVFTGVIRAAALRLAAAHANLPALPLPAVPPLAGMLDGTLALAGDYHSYLVNGRVRARSVTYNGRYAADLIDAAFGGDLRMMQIDRAEASGPFGRLWVAGEAGTAGAAISGDLRSNLAVAAKIFGIAGVTGTVELPVTVCTVGRDLTAATSGATFAGVSVFGAPLRSLSGIVEVGERRFAVVADADVAGGEVIAGGDLARGIAVSGSGLHLPGAVSSGDIDAAAVLQATGTAFQARGTGLLTGLRAGSLTIDGSSAFSADPQRLHLGGGVMETNGLIALVDGDITDLTNGGALDLHGRVVNASIATLAQRVAPQTARLSPAGSADADLRVGGSFAAPRLTGRLSIPEGSLSGLAFRSAHAGIEASTNRVRLRHGAVIVGDTAVRLGGAYDGRRFRTYISAPRANLADFDDAFDQPDMLAGTGRLRVSAATGAEALRTTADVDLRDVRVGNFVLGTTRAHWRSAGSDIGGSLGIDGDSGRLTVTGDLLLPAQAPTAASLRQSRLNIHGTANDLDLARWLPALGLAAPVTGRLDIAGRATGSMPTLTADLSLQAHAVTAAGVPVDEAEARIIARNGKGTLEQARVVVQGASADASGTFGFSPTDPIKIALHAQAPHIDELARRVVPALHNAQASSTLAALQPLDGAASTSFAIDGSTAKPRFTGALDVESGRLHGLVLPRALASFTLEGNKLNLTDGEVTLERGGVTISGTLPLELSPFSIGPAAAPLSLDLSADSLDLSSFTSLLPPRSEVHGLLDGAIALEGTPASPQLFGELNLGGGSFVSPLESIPIRDAKAGLRLGGRSANLTASATVGGGVFTLAGNAGVANLTSIGFDTAYALHATADKAAVDLANYGRGTIDADVSVSHANNGVPHVDGTIALSNAQVPFSAFDLPSSKDASPSNSLLAQTLLNVRLIAGKNARVRSGSIDLGASGAATLGGTVGAPTLDGAFTSTGGTLTYFNRSFHVASGRVAFDPNDGIDPQLTASATTILNDPDTNAAYNTSGRVTITLNVNGSLDHLNVALSSDPSYDRQQILGLLLNVPFLGAVHFNQATGDANSGANGLNLPGANTNSGQVTVSQEAFSFVNAQFTQSLLAPISTALGGAVGLSDLTVDFDQTGGLDLSARRHIVGNIYAFFRDSIGVPTRQSLGVDFEPNDATAVSFSIFQEQGLSTLGRTGTPAIFTPQQNLPETASSTSGGATTSGVSFSLNRRFP